MSDIITKHGGNTITYRTEENLWHCFDLGLSAPSLKGLIPKINAHHASIRRIDKIAVFEISYGESVEKGILTSIADNTGAAWIINSRKRREKVQLSTLIFDTPENRDALAAWKLLLKEVKAAERRAEIALKNIRRVTRAALLEKKVEKAEAEA